MNYELLYIAFGAKIRPLSQWPVEPTHNRALGPFTASLNSTIYALQIELKALQAKSVVLEFDFLRGEADFRVDGSPRAQAKLGMPGVILSFESTHGPLRIWFDGFTRPDYNLRAITQHLNHLRMASAYGVGRRGEQYSGWKALPQASPAMTKADALAYIVHHGGGPIGANSSDYLTSPDELHQLYRFAASRLHPDQPTGSHEAFIRLGEARDMLTELGVI